MLRIILRLGSLPTNTRSEPRISRITINTGWMFPTHAEIIAKFQSMIDRHPKTTFVAVHFSNLGHDLAQLGKALDKFPNLNVNLSARAYEFGRQPFTAPAFFAKYKNRILYGSDQTVSREMWRSLWYSGIRWYFKRDLYRLFRSFRLSGEC